MTRTALPGPAPVASTRTTTSTAPSAKSRLGAVQGRAGLAAAEPSWFAPRLGVDLRRVRVDVEGGSAAATRPARPLAKALQPGVVFHAGQHMPALALRRSLLARPPEPEQYGVLQRQVPGSGAPPLTAAPASFSITQIPLIMTANSWHTGAALMNDWFSRGSSAVPSTGTPNTTATTMAWALGFSRAKTVYDQLVADKIWVNGPAQTVIRAWLDRLGLPGAGASRTFGAASGSVLTVDPDYVNYRVVSQGLTAPLDGLAAALANFVFRVVVEGTVTDTGASPWYALGTARSYRVDVARVGVYIRDSYDFNGSQDLGCWNPISNAVTRLGLGDPNSHCVGNSDFQAWRTANGRGGDFFLYSDVTSLSTADSFTFNK